MEEIKKQRRDLMDYFLTDLKEQAVKTEKKYLKERDKNMVAWIEDEKNWMYDEKKDVYLLKMNYALKILPMDKLLVFLKEELNKEMEFISRIKIGDCYCNRNCTCTELLLMRPT